MNNQRITSPLIKMGLDVMQSQTQSPWISVAIKWVRKQYILGAPSRLLCHLLSLAVMEITSIDIHTMHDPESFDI